jgi:hypothetical protein
MTPARRSGLLKTQYQLMTLEAPWIKGEYHTAETPSSPARSARLCWRLDHAASPAWHIATLCTMVGCGGPRSARAVGG